MGESLSMMRKLNFGGKSCTRYLTIWRFLLTFFNSHVGLSGIINKPAKYTAGIAAHTQLKLTHDVMAPTINTNSMPIVRNSWKHVPSAPLIDVSASSEMNIGVTTQAPPIDIPKAINVTIRVNSHYDVCRNDKLLEAPLIVLYLWHCSQ